MSLLQRVDRVGRTPVVILRECQLVEHARRTIVEGDVGAVAVGGRGIPPERQIDVAERVDGAGGRRIQFRGAPEIAQRRLLVSPAPVGVPPLEVADHRVAFEGDGTAVGFDGARRVVLGEGASPWASSSR